MTTLERQKEKLETSKERLKQREKLIKLREQKEKNKGIYQIGRIAKKASLLDMDREALLGAFLEISERSKNQKDVERWKEQAQSYSNESSERQMDSVVVSFAGDPSNEAKKLIKDFGLKWNRFRNEWYGYASLDEVKSSLEMFEASVTSV